MRRLIPRVEREGDAISAKGRIIGVSAGERKEGDQQEDENGLEFFFQNEGEEPGEEVGYAVDFEEAREAADLHAIIQDLSFVTQVCDRLEDRLLAQEANAQEEDEHPTLDVGGYTNRSLWIAALTTYGRCFLKGIRYSLPESLFLRTPGMDYTHLHRYYMNMRDKHVAHSVNALEANDAVVSLSRRADGSLAVDGLGMVYISLAHPHHSEVQRLGNMAGYASGYAQDAYRDANRRALEKARSLSQDELNKLRPYEFRGKEGFVSEESAKAMGRSRRGRNRKKNRDV